MSSAGSNARICRPQFGPDRTTRARHQHPFAGQVAGDRGDVGLDLAAPERVGDLDVADPFHRGTAVEQLANGRHHLEGAAGVKRDPLNVADEVGVGVGHRKDHGGSAGAPHRPREVASATEHGHAVDAEVALVGVIVEQADGKVGTLAVPQDRPNEIGSVRARGGTRSVRPA